jgi:N-acetylglucosaminyl-diphospho-decaprenol L-rhamnosyltransferase
MSAPSRPALSVVTVLFRSGEVLRKTLPTWVTSARGVPVEFIFVDHTPADGGREVIEECLGRPDGPPHRYLPDPANPGFAAGCNRGVTIASAAHVLLLNPDVWLDDTSLARIVSAVAEAPEEPVAVGLTVRGREHVGIALHPVSLFIDRAAGARRDALGPSGGAGVYPTALLRRFGGFHEPLFAWGEDAELAFRLYAAGVPTRPLALGLTHAGGHSVEGDRALVRYRAFLLARNRLLVTARTFSTPLLLVAAPAIVVGHGVLGLRRAAQGLLAPFLTGLARGIAGWPAARRSWRGPRFGIRSALRYRRGGSVR